MVDIYLFSISILSRRELIPDLIRTNSNCKMEMIGKPMHAHWILDEDCISAFVDTCSTNGDSYRWEMVDGDSIVTLRGRGAERE